MTPFSNAFRDADVNFDDWDAKFGLSDREKVRRRRRDVSKKRRTYRTTLADRETQNTRALSGERKAVNRRTLSARRQEDNRLEFDTQQLQKKLQRRSTPAQTSYTIESACSHPPYHAINSIPINLISTRIEVSDVTKDKRMSVL